CCHKCVVTESVRAPGAFVATSLRLRMQEASGFRVLKNCARSVEEHCPRLSRLRRLTSAWPPQSGTEYRECLWAAAVFGALPQHCRRVATSQSNCAIPI